jgi:type IV secretory pathway VirB10-like protein
LSSPNVSDTADIAGHNGPADHHHSDPEENNMTDTTAFSESFSKFVPGFEFLQGLVKNAGQTLPSIGQWVAPTLDPAELERRINELRTVQFWLEQNARMIGTTVQALEVQRMTLGTLKSMNVQMGDLGEALKVRPMSDLFQAASAAAAAPPPAPAPTPAPAPAPTAPAPAAAPVVDPMQWWGALTQQFTELATQAMQATSDATAETQARAAEALQATTETAASVSAAASTPAPKAAAPRKTTARKPAKG